MLIPNNLKQVTDLFPHCQRCFLVVARKILGCICTSTSSMLHGSETSHVVNEKRKWTDIASDRNENGCVMWT